LRHRGLGCKPYALEIHAASLGPLTDGTVISTLGYVPYIKIYWNVICRLMNLDREDLTV
jgi:hypothetical protein